MVSRAGKLWRTAAPGRRDEVRGRIDSLADEAAAHGIRYERVRPAESIERPPPRTLDPEVPEVFARLARHTHPEAFVAVIPDARIAGVEPLVFTHDFHVLLQSTWDREQLDANPVLHGPLPRARRVHGPHATLVNPWCSAYFHWVLDTLPRAGLLPLAEQPELPVIVPQRLTAFQRETLDAIGIPPARRVGYDGTQMSVDELWFASLPRTGNPTRRAVGWLREQFAQRAPAEPSRRLYVTRAGAESRRVVNDAEVSEMLAERGFEVFRSEGVPFADQAQLFSEAGVIVGPHGAGLVNSFASRRATIVELFEPGYVNGCYYALADAAGHDYWFHVGERAGGSDIRVDVGRLAAILDATL